MKIAFYRSKHGGLVDGLINMFSGRGGFSHVELIFSDGTFFSSSGEDGGVRFKKITPNHEHWRVFDIPLRRCDEPVVRYWCQKQIGKKYDWMGVIGLLFPTRHEQGRWFCSEICVAALQRVGLFHGVPPWKVSPNALHLILEVAAHDDFTLGEFAAVAE